MRIKVALAVIIVIISTIIVMYGKNISSRNTLNYATGQIVWALNIALMPDYFLRNPTEVMLSPRLCNSFDLIGGDFRVAENTDNPGDRVRYCSAAVSANRRKYCVLWWVRTDCLAVYIPRELLESEKRRTSVRNVMARPCKYFESLKSTLIQDVDGASKSLLASFKSRERYFGCDGEGQNNTFNVIVVVVESDTFSSDFLDFPKPRQVIRKYYPDFIWWRIFK